MTLAELEEKVFAELAESASSPAFWTSVDVRAAINEGYEEISDATEWYERTTSVHLLARRTYHDLRGYVLNSGPILTIRRIFLPTFEEWICPVHVREIDGDNDYGFGYHPRWEESQTTPGFWFLRSLFWLGIYPRMASDGEEVARISHSSLPKALEHDDDQPGFPEPYHEALVEYALYELKVRDRESILALTHWDNYRRIEQELYDYVDQRQSVDRLLRMGEERPVR